MFFINFINNSLFVFVNFKKFIFLIPSVINNFAVLFPIAMHFILFTLFIFIFKFFSADVLLVNISIDLFFFIIFFIFFIFINGKTII